ncbi:MAG: hypothetical protein U9N85_05780 [Bacteroidota bacterium]|nr:hypothetical protein [Bacteroidota bacterium]
MKNFIKFLFKRREKIEKKDRLFYVRTSKISDKQETKSGLITGLGVEKGFKFIEITFEKPPVIKSKERGISVVEQQVEVEFTNREIYDDLKAFQDYDFSVSLLHIKPNGKAFLYGENIGLFVTGLSEKKLSLQGKEEDTFYSVDSDFAAGLV